LRRWGFRHRAARQWRHQAPARFAVCAIIGTSNRGPYVRLSSFGSSADFFRFAAITSSHHAELCDIPNQRTSARTSFFEHDDAGDEWQWASPFAPVLLHLMQLVRAEAIDDRLGRGIFARFSCFMSLVALSGCLFYARAGARCGAPKSAFTVR